MNSAKRWDNSVTTFISFDSVSFHCMLSCVISCDVLRCLWFCKYSSLPTKCPTECLMASAFKFYSYLDEVGGTSMRAEKKDE